MIVSKNIPFINFALLFIAVIFLLFILQQCAESFDKTEQEIRADFVQDSLEVVLESIEDSVDANETRMLHRQNNSYVTELLKNSGIEVNTVSCLLDADGGQDQICTFKSGPALLSIKCREFQSNRKIRTCDLSTIGKMENSELIKVQTMTPETTHAQ